jgi:hypothetical protein
MAEKLLSYFMDDAKWKICPLGNVQKRVLSIRQVKNP